MHLLNSVRTKMTCVPFVNEIGAAIAAEYFTAASNSGEKAFVLVTAGPGLTNTVTALASAWTESRELLVIGGQVKASDLALGNVRQMGIQEIDGVEIVRSITKAQLRISSPVNKFTVMSAIRSGATARKGPVFIEVTLDAQASEALSVSDKPLDSEISIHRPSDSEMMAVFELLNSSKRPILLLGSGVDKAVLGALESKLLESGIPLMLTWNGASLLPDDFETNFGRPNTWGQRYSNVLLQQADLLIAVGTRLGLQQTGFAYDEFLPLGNLVHVDIDTSELEKHPPKPRLGIACDANIFLEELMSELPRNPAWKSWLEFAVSVKHALPTSEKSNKTRPGYINPFDFMIEISGLAKEGDCLIPCSSGGSFTVAMQTLKIKRNQKLISNKGMASMGYGLSGAIGAALANPSQTTFLFEGDGGFAQNLQELGTLSANQNNLKIFLFANDGYASIRMTQRNYFDGAWVGCDSSTGLGLPEWKILAQSFGLKYVKLSGDSDLRMSQLREVVDSIGPVFVEVPIDPDQTYLPKIASRVLPDGSMKSNPLHRMEPPVSDEIGQYVFRYLNDLGHDE